MFKNPLVESLNPLRGAAHALPLLFFTRVADAVCRRAPVLVETHPILRVERPVEIRLAVLGQDVDAIPEVPE
jgi:hypothetical protein